MKRGWQYVWLGLWVWVLVACGSSTTSSDTTAAPAQTQTTEVPATLVVWHALDTNQAFWVSERIQHIAEQNGFAVVIQAMPAASLLRDVMSAWPQARGPHVVILSNSQLAQLSRAQLALPLEALLEQTHRESIPANILSTTAFTGSDGQTHLMGVPITYTLPVLYYHMRNILSAPTTSDDLLSIAYSMYAPPQWGLGADLSFDTMSGYLSAFDAQIIDDQNTVVLGSSGRAGSEAWLTWLATLNADAQLLTRLNAVFQIERAVGSGNLTMVIDMSDRYTTYRQVWGEATGITALPDLSFTNTHATPFIQSTAIAVNPRLSSREVAAATMLINGLVTPDSQEFLRDAGIQPSNGRVDLDAHPILHATAAAAEHAEAAPVALLRSDVYAILRTMMTQVMIGTQTPSDAVTAADQQLRQLLAESNTP